MAMGYDTSELNFYPNKPYLATFYKSKPGKLGTTNTPAKEGRQVIETWNSGLFYALCCQLEGDAITPGEFFTDNNGKIHQSTRVDDKWIIVDYPGGKNDAFKKPQCHKSTFEEFLAWYTGEDVKVKSLVMPTVTRTSKGIVVDGGSSNKSILAAITEIGSEIINSKKGLSIEQMKSVANEHGVKVADPVIEMNEEVKRFNPTAQWMDSVLLSPGIVEKRVQTEGPSETIVIGRGIVEPKPVNESFVETGQIQSVDSSTFFDITPIESNQSLTGPMTFKELLSWFGEGNSVVVGSIEEREIKCVPFEIEAVSRDVATMVGKEKPVPFGNIYKSKEAFLLHALTTLKKQA